MLAQRTHEHLKASAVCRPILATSFLTGEMFFLLDQLFQRLLFMWWIAEEHQLLRRQFDFPLWSGRERAIQSPSYPDLGRSFCITVQLKSLTCEHSWRERSSNIYHITEIFCSDSHYWCWEQSRSRLHIFRVRMLSIMSQYYHIKVNISMFKVDLVLIMTKQFS